MDFKKINIYNKILSLFVTKEKFKPDWMRQPFNLSSDTTKSAATTAYEMVVVPKNLSYQWHGDKAINVYPNAHVLDFKIDVEDIRAFIKKVPNEMVEVSYPKFSKCEACKGSKSVDYTYVWDDENYRESLECPVCNGEGRLTVGFEVESHTEEKYSEAYAAKILEKFFSANRLDKLVKVADLLNENSIKLVYSHAMSRPNPMTGFLIGDVEVILMPIMDNEEFNEVDVIKLVGQGEFAKIIVEKLEGNDE